MKTFQQIMSEKMRSELDTDHGVLNAYWKTGKELIDQCKQSGTTKETYTECLKFYKYFFTQFGEFKAKEFLGDMVDAGVACYGGNCLHRRHRHRWGIKSCEKNQGKTNRNIVKNNYSLA